MTALPDGAQLLLDVAEVLELRHPGTAASLEFLATVPRFAEDLSRARALLTEKLPTTMLDCLPPALVARIGAT